jgi:hypothetical protein
LSAEVVLSEAKSESPINAALRQFEAAEANLEKLQHIWSEIKKMTPEGITFGGDPKYDDRLRAYRDLLSGLPKIDGWQPEAEPMDLDDIAQSRLDAKECGEISAEVAVEQLIGAPGRELGDYRHRLNKKRRQLVRNAMSDFIALVDETVQRLKDRILPDTQPSRQLINDSNWESLKDDVRAIETLLGSALPRPPRWDMLLRHLHFGMVADFQDIVRFDWPAVKSGLTKGLYDIDEPLPVQVEDLGVLAATQPTGPVATRLKWPSLSDEDFERLIFALIGTAPGYENPSWLSRTSAPDRGRDLSVVRVTDDRLSGVMRARIIIQCKHWLTKSISLPDIVALVASMTLWEPPKVDVLIIATSGRFTTDAIDWVEKHNQGDHALHIEMWPESHLERLLAERPGLIAEFGLR